MGIEKLGVIVKKPDAQITMNAAAYGELVGYMFSHGRNLQAMVQILNQINPGGAHEALSEMQGNLHLMSQVLQAAIIEMLRIGEKQGLQFQEIPPVAAVAGQQIN